MTDEARIGVGVREKPFRFGPGEGLFGILSGAGPSKLAVILLNAGLVHRAGPFRLHVSLARALAGDGYPVFRIDQSALGDSEARGGGSYEERAVADAAAAMDFLADKIGAEQFVLIGLCAGAMNAHRAACDPRVVGAVLLDGYAYRTQAFYAQRIASRAVDPAAWRGALRRLRREVTTRLLPAGSSRTRMTTQVKDAVPGQDAAEIFAADWPPREQVARELLEHCRAQKQLLFIYTGGWSDYVHQGQFGEMFPEVATSPNVSVQFFEDADHTYFLKDHRERMLAAVRSWAALRFPLANR